MINKLDNFVSGIFKIGFFLIIILVIVLGIVCSCDAFGNTWTIEDGHFKSIYDDLDECLKTNSGTATTDKCYDNTKVIYKNRQK